MSYPNIATSGIMAQEIAQRLAGIGSTLKTVQSFGASGDPLIKVALTTGAASTQTALIRLTTRPSLFLNAVGNASEVYAPALTQLAIEASATADVQILTLPNLMIVLGTALRYGSQLELWLVTNTNAVIESAFAGTNAALEAVFDASLKYGAQSSI